MDRARLTLTAALALVFTLGAAPQGQAPVAPKPTASVEKFQPARAWADLLTQVQMGPRPAGTDTHVKCKDWLVAEMKKSCDDVRTQEFGHIWSRGAKRIPMWNVVGEQNWKDAKVRVLLIAHWDTRPSAEQDPTFANRRKPIVGANDGASGVAVLLELMRAFKEQAPEGVGIQYLMTDGEDLGPGIDEMFLGAVHYASNLSDPKPDYGILLDMIGDKDLRVPMEPNSIAYARPIIDALYKHAKTVGLDDAFPSEEGPEILDDHLAINRAGIRTIDLIDFDYPSWHTMADTADKCSAESLGKVGRLLETFLRKQPSFKPR